MTDSTTRWFFATNPLRITSIDVDGSALSIDGLTLPFVADDWAGGGSFRFDNAVHAVSAQGGWTDESHLVIQVRTADAALDLTLRFAVDGATVDFEVDRTDAEGTRRINRLIGGVRQ